LVSTDLTGRGIDISYVRFVLNFDLPWRVENYIHRVGRTGRFGKNSLALSLIVKEEV